MDAVAIERLYRTHSFAVFRRCRQLLRCEALAQDVLQEVFLRLLEAPDAFAGRARVSTYLYAIASNHCLNRLRNDRRRGRAWQQAVLAEWQGGARSDFGGEVERRQMVEALLREEDPVTALIALHHYVDGMSQGEIAEVVGLSRVTVNQRLGRFRERARQRLGEVA